VNTRRLLKKLRPYLPNGSDEMMMTPIKAPIYGRKVKLTQIIGGRTWSLSVVRHGRLSDDTLVNIPDQIERYKEGVVGRALYPEFYDVIDPDREWFP
jgi:hypothetical protein